VELVRTVRSILRPCLVTPIGHGVPIETIGVGMFPVAYRRRLCLHLQTDRWGGSGIPVPVGVQRV